MSSFYLVNEKRFPLPVETPVGDNKGCNVDLLPYYRWEHRLTVGYNLRRYMVFLDNFTNTVYVEDCTDNLEQVKDDQLWNAMVNFAKAKGYLDIMAPLMKDSKSRFV